ncbi:sugar MFS transporter [Colwellia sp. Bg11-28]|uniref:sugar MFS transporter n=1 Tax=Colwellia sp. Bg11-28 TaxID=2058305 RepID=UPI000C325E53|nr:sugar MFS transporter [Colwellia sp. Bg11-28]PKH88531.1 glucose/galactose MFS transporter [Colwellia sp. Bg11-28]
MSTAIEKNNSKQSSFIPMVIVGGLFFVFGFVTWLNGSLIPFLKIACELNHMEAYLVTMAFYIAYTIMALPVAAVLKRVGYKNGMVYGLLVMAIGAVIFIPAAQARMYSVFLLALFILASGLTMLQTAANPYIVLLGPKETAAVRISIMGLLNKSAGIIAPIVFTAFVLSDISQFDETRLAMLDEVERNAALLDLSSRLVMPYIVMAIMLAILAVMIKFSPLPEPVLEDDKDDSDDKWAILRFPQLIFGALTLFFYIGVEVIAGDTIGLFGQEMGVTNFGQLTSYTMAFMVVAYLTGMAVIPRFISQETALALSGALGIILTILLLTSSVESADVWQNLFSWTGVPEIPNVVLYVALLGFANALVWPAIWPMALDGLGKHTSTGSALLIMGISGGALMPMIYGYLVESSGNSQSAYWIMLPCYLIILWYALHGHKIKSWTK